MASYTWNGSANDGNYNNPANWTPPGVPGAADTVSISTTAATAINASNSAANTLTTNAHVTLNVNDNTSFTFGSAGGTSTFTNGGTLALNSQNSATFLMVDASKLTLSGAGTILLGNNNNNFIEGALATDTLVNTSNLIEGSGQLGNGSLTFSNGTAGVVDANQPSTLVLNTGTISVSNAGLLEATSGALLAIESTVVDTTAGRITAAGGNVALYSGATIQGGTLATSAGGVIEVSGGQTGTLSALTNKGSVLVNDNATLGLAGTIVNAGTITLASGNSPTELVVEAATVSLTGTGSVLLSDNANNYITGAAATDMLVNVNNTIAGSGHLGNGMLTIVNSAAGTISATGTNNALILNTGSILSNSGLIEGVGPATLVVQNTLISNTASGTLFAAAGSAVVLENGAVVQLGTLNTSGTGVIEVVGGQTATLSSLTNKGNLQVNDNANLDLAGTIVNTGAITLGSANSATELIIDSATVSLTGTGTVVLSDNPNNYITAAAAGDKLINVNNVISGAGHFGNGTLTLVNNAAGTISATGNNALVLNTGSTVTNNGLIEGVGPGELVIQNSVINSSGGGTIFAATGSGVSLQTGTTLQGGTVNSAGTGAVVVNNGQTATLDGTAHTVTNLGTVQIQDNGALTVLGTIANQGTIQLGSQNSTTILMAGAPAGATPTTVTLTGSGKVVLSNNNNNYIEGAATGDGLINLNNTITGAGVIGNGQLTFTNDGTVNANQSNVLFLHTGSTITNNGLLEATLAGSGLIVQNDAVSNAGGTVLANNGGAFELQNGAAIDGGLVETATGGVFAVTNNETGTLSGAASAITLQGSIEAIDSGTINLLGQVINDGTISLLSANSTTELLVNSPTVTLTGGGSIVLSDNNNNYIFGTVAADVLDNVNNTISGAGQLGNSQLTLINAAAGIIDATGGASLVLDTGNTVTNSGLIEATGTGGLIVRSDTVQNGTLGKISAFNSNVYLQNGAAIAGGSIVATGTGAVVVQNGQTGTLDGSAHTLTNLGSVSVNDNGTLNLLGAIANDSTISVLSGNSTTELLVNSPTVTLTGGGSIALSDNNNNYIFGAVATDVLDNVNNTISGAGQLGNSQLTLINEADGTIDATGGSALVIDTGHTVTNNGDIDATGAGGLIVRSDTIQNGSLGVLSASSSNIYLQSAGTLAGGTISTAGGGAFVVQNGQSGTLDGSAHTLTSLGSVNLTDNGTLYLIGAIANKGTISVGSQNSTTELLINSPTVTLTGSGVVALSDNSNNYIFGLAAADVLDNVNNTIAGAGHLGNGQLTLVNAGTISANQSNTLTINLGSTGTNTATGVLLGSGSGGLAIQNGTYTNAGLIKATDGSNVTFSNGAILTNDSAGTLTGGTYSVLSTGDGATITLAGPAVTTDAATLLYSGVGASINVGGTDLQTSLVAIAAKSQLQLQNGASFTTTQSISNAGTIALAGGTLTANVVTDRFGSALSGYGTLNASLASPGPIIATGGNLVLEHVDNITGAISGTGTLVFNGAHATLGLAGPITVPEIIMINRSVLVLTKTLTFAGILDIQGAASISGTAGVVNSGLFEQTGAGGGAITAAFTNSGTILTNPGGSFTFSGGLTNSGLIEDNGVFNDSAALTGGTLAEGYKGAATIASASGAGPSTIGSLSLNAATLNTSGTTLTVTGDYTNTATGAGNAYKAEAGVTGTINGQGTKLAVVGVEGTTITTVNGTLTVTVAAGQSAHFEIENTGASGSATLRGALQTTVNGANITGSNLSGNGVTASNFGPIAAGGHSGIYTIAYSSGALTGEAIHLASDFANVAGLTIDIVSASGSAATPAFAGSHLPELTPAAMLAWAHHG